MNYMPLSDFKNAYPDLYEKVIKKKFVEAPPFVYHLTKGQNVQRQALMDNPQYRLHWRQRFEKVNHGCPSDRGISKIPKSIHTRKFQKKLVKSGES